MRPPITRREELEDGREAAFILWQQFGRRDGSHGPTMTAALPASPASDDPYADRRNHPRVSVALPAFMVIGGRRYPVQIVDLSAGGAKVDCGTALVVAGAIVTLNWGASAQATVRWREGRQAGLAFAAELDARDVADLARRSDALSARMRG